MIIWGGWLLVTGAVLSYASGIIHTYYTVELAPAIAALVAIGAVVLWRRRADLSARLALAAGVLVTACWSYELLRRDAGWHPWVGWLRRAGALAGIAALLIPPATRRGPRRLAIVAGVSSRSPAARRPTRSSTAATPHTGSTPSAGPTAISCGGFGGGGAGRPGGFGGGAGAAAAAAALAAARRTDGFPGGTGGAATGSPATADRHRRPTRHRRRAAAGDRRLPAARPGGGGGGATSSSALITLLKTTDTKWAAATIGSQSAAPLELASRHGRDGHRRIHRQRRLPDAGPVREAGSPTGKIHYFIGGGGIGGGPGGGGSVAARSQLGRARTSPPRRSAARPSTT